MPREKLSRAEIGGKFLLRIGVPVLSLFYFFTPLRSIQFLALFLMLLILSSKFYSEYLVRCLRIVRRDKELRVFRNEWLDIELWIENQGRLPAFMLALGDSPGGIAVFRNAKCLCALGGRRRQLFRWEAYGSSRGVYTLGPAVIRGSDPLGLFPFTMVCKETTQFFVYPAPAYAAIKTPGGIPLGNLITPDPFNEDLTRPRSLRDYYPGDESKRINWKASAKTSGFSESAGSFSDSNLLVNEYEPSLSYPMVVFLNVNPMEYGIRNRERYIERVIEVTAALCLMAARQRQTLGLIINSSASKAESTEKTSGSFSEDSAEINPAAFTLIPILQRLAALEPFKNMGHIPSDRITSPGGMKVSVESKEPELFNASPLRPSTERLLEKGKTLSFGTRLIYTGPILPEADYHALETLRKRRLSLEYILINEKNVEHILDGNYGAHRNATRVYQMKEMGYAII